MKGDCILSYPILSYPILSYPILSYPILSYPILSYPNVFDCNDSILVYIIYKRMKDDHSDDNVCIDIIEMSV